MLALPAAVDQSIGPGLGGFLVTFFMAVALVVLVRSMVKHLRKVRYSPDPAQRPTRQIVIPNRTAADPRPGATDPNLGTADPSPGTADPGPWSAGTSADGRGSPDADSPDGGSSD